MPLIHVAVPVPALDLLTYRVPEDIALPSVGARVVVPLGSRIVTGIVIETDVDGTTNDEPRTTNDERRTTNVKEIREVLDADAFVPPDVVALARWVAEYYAAGVGDAIPALLPPMARGARADAHKTTRMAAITAAGLEALEARASTGSARADDDARPELVEGRALTAKQREALELLAGTPTGLPTPVLAARGIAADAISRLTRHGYISLRHDRIDRDPFKGTDGGQMGIRHQSDPHRTPV